MPVKCGAMKIHNIAATTVAVRVNQSPVRLANIKKMWSQSSHGVFTYIRDTFCNQEPIDDVTNIDHHEAEWKKLQNNQEA